MQAILITIHLMVVAAQVVTVLLQRSEGGALGQGGGGGFMTGRGQANALTRATGILAAIFFATSLGLTILANYGRAPKSVFDTGGAPASSTAPAVPVNGLDALKLMQQQKQAAPPATEPAPASDPAPATDPAPVTPDPAKP